MKAAVMRDWELRVDDVPDPVPGDGQVLAKVLACGICGSDLHMLRHGAEVRAFSEELRAGQPDDPLRAVVFEPERDTVMGHEFCCEVVDLGPGCENLKVGDRVVSMPAAFDESGVHAVGYSNRYPGGYGELMVLNEMLGLKVPDALPSDLAAMTEPLAVGRHAVARSRIGTGDGAIVVGLGPVGLAVLAELRMRGIGPVVAADFSATRRALAEAMGADVVVDPRVTPAIEAWRAVAGARSLVIFEAVGVPGMIDQVMRMAPTGTQVVVVGVCMPQDSFHPFVGITKELNLQFVLGYQPDEFADSLSAIAEEQVDLARWITGVVGVDGVPQAFADLADPDAHAKIMVRPG